MRWWFVLVLCAGCADPATEPGPEEAPRSGGAHLSDEAFRFCHVPGADAEAVRPYCALLDDLSGDPCPGMRATCDGEPPRRADDAWASSGCGGGASGPGTALPPPPRPASEPVSCRAPEGCAAPTARTDLVALVAKWVAALGVALVIGLFVRWMLRTFGRVPPAAAPPSPPLVTDVVADVDGVPELPSDDLLDRARAALDASRYDEAVLLARGAALRHLGEAGRVRLHRSRTDREYVRELRGDREVHAPLRALVDVVERIRWGAAPVGRDAALAGIRAAERILAALSLLVVLVGAGGDAYRFGPDGDAALHALFTAHDHRVSWRLRGLASLDDDVDVLVLDRSGLRPSEAERAALREWVERGGLLVVGGDPTGTFPEVGVVVALEADTGVRRGALLEGAGVALPRWPGGPSAGIVDGGGVPWVLAGDGAAVVASVPVGEGAVLAIADPRLLRNGALVHPDNAAFLGGAPALGADLGLWRLDAPAHLQLATLSGAGSASPAEALRRADLLPAVLQLLALAVVAALWLGWPFAPFRDPPGEGRRRFSEHVRALGARYARIGATRHVLSAQAALWLSRLGPEGLREAAVRSGHSREASERLIRDLQRVADDPDGDDPHDEKLLEALWTLTRRR